MSGARLPSSFDGNTDFYEENRLQKFFRRLKEEPLIPLGCGLTCWALLGASRSIRAGDHHATNRMFRARIYAQGFTLVAIVAGGFYYAEDREKRKEYEGVKTAQKAREKNEAWIRELEARDREDREEARRNGERRSEMKRIVEEKDAYIGVGVAKATEERNADTGVGVAASVAERNADMGGIGVAKSMVEVGEERWKGGILDAVKELSWR